MEIKFRTKEESNKLQREDFLKLSPVDRFYTFLNLMYLLKDYPTKKPKKKNNNFILVINCDEKFKK